VNWLGSPAMAAVARRGLAVHARIRSTHAPVPALLALDGPSRARVVLRHAEHGVAPGQACVFYADGTNRARMLGGGFIARTHEAGESVSGESKLMLRSLGLAG
jgi:tRNA-specific 2-thiouridylase